ncbi:hypothetical protein LCGC14_0556610 [marine sediment metagenome]|uniref:Uncharacterized protein n=1 Tax=marine sediment metagenome TaxID=412755 RepID=A0A0F9UWJ4_9ZZZZ
MKQNKDKQRRELRRDKDSYFRLWVVFMVIAFLSVGWVLWEDYKGDRLKQELQSCQDKVPVKCYFINEVTTRYWIPEENLIVGENTYIENITERSCEVILESEQEFVWNYINFTIPFEQRCSCSITIWGEMCLCNMSGNLVGVIE